MSGQTVAYVRVSSLDQNVARQVEAVGDATKTFVDRVSGKGRGERSALTQLMEWVREGDTVRVASMDRLARSVIDLHAIVDELTDKGVRVQFVKEGLTFSPGSVDPTARLLLGVVGSVAEFERAIIRERQAEGIRAAKARGVYRGRARSLNVEQVENVKKRIAAGVPKAQIARDLEVSRQTLYNALAASTAPNSPLPAG